MSFTRGTGLRFFSLFWILIIGSLFYVCSDATGNTGYPVQTMADISFLQFDITPTRDTVPAGEPCEVKVTVQNTDDSEVTLLKWGNPLDSTASVTGVFEIRDLTANTAVNTDIIKFMRKMPPSPDDLAEIGPHSSTTTLVNFKMLKLTAGHKYSIRAKGWWQAVWQLPESEVVKEHLNSISGGLSGNFASNTIEFHQVSFVQVDESLKNGEILTLLP